MLQVIYRLVMAVIFVGSMTICASAQEDNNLQAAFGLVVKTSASDVVISQYNSEQETDQEATYTVDSQTHLEGVTAVSEFVPGEEVEILYQEVNGAKAAKFISKELLLEEETLGDYTADTEDISEDVVELPEAIGNISENVVEMPENTEDFSGNVVEAPENVVDMPGNVVDSDL